MSYCQFENAVDSLRPVLDALRGSPNLEYLLQKSSSYEQDAIKDLPKLCKKILDQYKDFTY